MQLIESLSSSFRRQIAQPRTWTLETFLEACKKDKALTAHPAAGMLHAIGNVERVDTSKDPRLSRLYDGATIDVYPAFKDDFFGLERTIARIVEYYRYASTGLETRKKILYLLGPPGTAKSALARRLKYLYGQCTMCVLAVKRDESCTDNSNFSLSPVLEHPLELFNLDEHEKILEPYGVRPYQYGTGGPSPWAWEKLREFGGNLDRFHVVEVPCSVGQQIGISRTEPSHTKLSVLIGERGRDGKYSYNGSLNRATQGLMEYAEIFKAPSDLLKALLAAMEDGFYEGDGKIGTIPFRGMVLAHSNQKEWDDFRNNQINAGFVDRMFTVEVPYSTSVSAEKKIYDRIIHNSGLADVPHAPHSTAVLAGFAILTRLPTCERTNPTIKQLLVFDGTAPEELGDGTLSLSQYREKAPSGYKEGMDPTSISTRTGFTTLAEAFFQDKDEIGVDPLLLLERLKVLAGKNESRRIFVEKELIPFYLGLLDRDIRLSYQESIGAETGEQLFERYCLLSIAWAYPEDERYRPQDAPADTVPWSSAQVVEELERIESKLKVPDPCQLRDVLAKQCMRLRGNQGGAFPAWEKHDVMCSLINRYLSECGDDMGAVIAFGITRNGEAMEKHARFIAALRGRGYQSDRQMRRLVTWYMEKKGISVLLPEDDQKKKRM